MLPGGVPEVSQRCCSKALTIPNLSSGGHSVSIGLGGPEGVSDELPCGLEGVDDSLPGLLGPALEHAEPCSLLVCCESQRAFGVQ